MNEILLNLLVILISVAMAAVASIVTIWIIESDGLIKSIKRLILVYSKALKDTVTYPIRFKILKYRCNRIIRLGHIGYLSRNEAKIIGNRLIDRHYEKYGKNYMNFDKYMDKD